MSDTGEEWQVARRRKGAARRSNTLQPRSSAAACCQEQLDVGKTIKRIRETASELRCEEFWKDWKDQLLVAGSASLSKPPENKKDTEFSIDLVEKGRDDRTSQHLECVCYGLGSFSSCVSARFQLAMLLLLLDAGQIPLKDCSVYDPAFSSGERDVLRELGLTVLTENEYLNAPSWKTFQNALIDERFMVLIKIKGDIMFTMIDHSSEASFKSLQEGKRPVTKPTLFYQMHCGKALYNNLLWKNWSTQRLPLMIIIGNSFNGIRDRTIEREFKRDYRYINQAVDVCEERQLPCPSRLIDVFSDTAVITFPSSSLNKLPQSTWTDPPEPQYQHCPDLEIILREARS